MSPTTKIYVSLLDEGTPTWRPTQGVFIRENTYKLLPTQNYNPEDETWEFLPGSIVRCELTEADDGDRVLLAVEKLGKSNIPPARNGNQVLLKVIERALRDEDIENLISAGAPEDEYDDEAKIILSALEKLEPHEFTEAQVVAIIAHIWSKAFDRSTSEIQQRMLAFRRVAQKILT